MKRGDLPLPTRANTRSEGLESVDEGKKKRSRTSAVLDEAGSPGDGGRKDISGGSGHSTTSGPGVGRKWKGRGSQEPLGRSDAIIPPGRPVAANVTNAKDKTQQWILAKTRHWYSEKGRYDVEDQEEDEAGQRPYVSVSSLSSLK